MFFVLMLSVLLSIAFVGIKPVYPGTKTVHLPALIEKPGQFDNIYFLPVAPNLNRRCPKPGQPV